MIIKHLANYLDFLKPTLYKAEKAVAARSIPSIVEVTGRKRLDDFDDVTTNQFDHSLWDGILKQHIISTDGKIEDVMGIHLVDYTAVTNDENFGTYLGLLEKAEVSSLPEPEQLAFWMNAYNALCISLLIKNMDKVMGTNGKYSINNLSKPGNPVWDQEAGVIGGKKYSLNDIEHNELRKKWAEPTVHGCIVCASASCPNLRREAFVGTAIKEQMADQMRQWMKNDTKGLKLEGKKLFLSRIFLWFADDFNGWDGLREWLPQFVDDEKVKAVLHEGGATVRYFEYNWQMNRAPESWQGHEGDASASCS